MFVEIVNFAPRLQYHANSTDRVGQLAVRLRLFACDALEMRHEIPGAQRRQTQAFGADVGQPGRLAGLDAVRDQRLAESLCGVGVEGTVRRMCSTEYLPVQRTRQHLDLHVVLAILRLAGIDGLLQATRQRSGCISIGGGRGGWHCCGVDDRAGGVGLGGRRIATNAHRSTVGLDEVIEDDSRGGGRVLGFGEVGQFEAHGDEVWLVAWSYWVIFTELRWSTKPAPGLFAILVRACVRVCFDAIIS